MHNITCKIHTNGDIQWMYRAGSLSHSHNNNGPATQYVSGTKYWIVDGNIHRLDGPAIEWHTGHKGWFINGIQFDNEFEYWFALQNYTFDLKLR